jgi:hypothetical protein
LDKTRHGTVSYVTHTHSRHSRVSYAMHTHSRHSRVSCTAAAATAEYRTSHILTAATVEYHKPHILTAATAEYHTSHILTAATAVTRYPMHYSTIAAAFHRILLSPIDILFFRFSLSKLPCSCLPSIPVFWTSTTVYQ